MAISFVLNGKSQTVDVSPEMPLLWVLRDTLNMTGTKFGCGMACCTGWLPSSESPSMVVIFFPAMVETGVTQERVASPST